MFKKLQGKWKVNGWNLLLIISTFALGGSLCGIVGRKLLMLSGIEKGIGWFILYIIVVTLLWPLSVLLVSIPLGQFRFFKRYISRIWHKMKGDKSSPGSQQQVTRIAIFASGAGSNAKNIIAYFKKDPTVHVALVVCNNPGAGVIGIAKENGIEVLMINKASLSGPGECLSVLQNRNINLVILAGFLWKLPPAIIEAYPKKIINIHPALLPAYGGKGMYGKHVHEAVIANHETESGISIHYADELYDHGEIIFQAKCQVTSSDTPETLAGKIHQLEQEHYPRVIETVLKKQNPR
jgi:formyltetrahydrofolate-dependent phosphoribosylglycinamide formyltransferase